jgi:hypothetical protein
MWTWLSRLSDLHVRFATISERVDALSHSITRLTDSHGDACQRIALIEGVLLNSLSPEIVRQMTRLVERVNDLERVCYNSQRSRQEPTLRITTELGNEG